ncbi:hypothetical protein [Actinophytocola algeriensis]|uniref:Uncharacterized protein n=1 Tax=Actinophytocola algeriensis TaxID=1768010 RepID=A0A7W7Q8H3_9PSEU|nr:hypothetical protein [Actinophytocola algeriensis]MBB4908980.1 hypothetical protein [Actinophytocola algeriensis]MBE1474632.1 hypothetical protein [Actinophytocola algeriensis]
MGFSERYLRPAGVAPAGDWRVKQYQVTVTEQPIEGAVVVAAEAYLPKLMPASAATDATPRVAFSVLHKGVDAVWLMAYAWVHGEIVHSRGASAGLDAPTSFTPLTEPLIGCVWELPALVHERSSWVRHGLQPEHAAVDAYLADVLPEGPVGGP